MNANKIVQFERSAEFYFDLGYKYIQKGKLKTALRYIEKAAKSKPKDDFVQFNYAGLLAELGEVEHSTEVLQNIVKNINPKYSECYFGLGCNYLQMQKIKKAIKYFEQYLEIDPDGEFSEEAEDLLEMLIMIKDANNNLDDDELEKIYKLEEDAIKHLERKEYVNAVEKFETVVELLPNAIPARNNLSLAYYYLGEVDKAIELAKEVLNYEPENIHANCNLTIYYNKRKLDNWVEKQVKEVKMLSSDNPDYLFKIADTLGSLGRHNDAYKAYKKLLLVESENSLYTHYAAIAAYNCGKYSESIRLWEKLEKLDKENHLSEYYIARARECMDDSTKQVPLMYLYQLPKDEISSRIDRIYKFLELSKMESQAFVERPENLELLYFALCFDKHFIRKLIFNKFKNDYIRGSEKILSTYALRGDVEDYIKAEIIFLLDILSVPKPYKIFLQGRVVEINGEPLNCLELDHKEQWMNVVDMAIHGMKGRYSNNYEDTVKKIWFTFIKYLYPEVPHISKAEVWAAALEYTYSRIRGYEYTQSEIAGFYGVSTGKLGEKYRLIFSIYDKDINK
ncbi:MAG: tetratricopeptide repeat protein [Bacillota bacterium]